MDGLNQAISYVYEMNEGSPEVEEYHNLHAIQSLLILTMLNKRDAKEATKRLAQKIYGKVVVEVGAGVGLAAIEMARLAKHVYAIEADPSWSWVFTKNLYRLKPANLTWIFGAAGSVSEFIRGDVAVIFTRSGFGAMTEVAHRMCPQIILNEENLYE